MCVRAGRRGLPNAPFDAPYSALLRSVPLPDIHNRGDALLFVEKIKRASGLLWMLDSGKAAAAACITAAAVSSNLAYGGVENKTMLAVYNRIDSLPSTRIPRPDSHMEEMINEFTGKAQAYGDIEEAKSNAKLMIIKYCKNIINPP